jgi:TnpA family transposase
MDLNACSHVSARLSKRIDTGLILANWDEMLRLAGSLKLGWVTASLIIQKLQASPRKSELTRALQEYGRLIKTRHALAWYESEEKRRWINRQLNKGEALHSLKAHLSIGNRGIIRRKSDEGLQHHVGSLNLLTNVIVLWNTVYMGEVIKKRQQEGQVLSADDLAHIWPTRFEHINVYGKYEFDLEKAQQRGGLRRLRSPDDSSP